MATTANKNHGKQKLYAVTCGHKRGLFENYDVCKESIKGYPCNSHKGFTSIAEAVTHMNRNDIGHTDIEVYTGKTALNISKPVPLSEYCKKKNIEVPPVVPTSNPVLPEDAPAVFIDGACVNNGQENPMAGYGIYWGQNHALNTSEPVPSSDLITPTNQRAELYSAIKLLEQVSIQDLPMLVIKSDSEYVIEGIVSYCHGWKKSGSLKHRPNADLWDQLSTLVEKATTKLSWVHVKGHNGIPGNEAADKLAQAGAGRYSPHLADPPVANETNVPDDKAKSQSDQPLVDTTKDSSEPVENTVIQDGKSQDESKSCIACSSLDSDYMLQCAKCESWVHYSCSELPRYQLFNFYSTGRKFECHICTAVPVTFKTNIPEATTRDTAIQTVPPSLHAMTTQTDIVVLTDPTQNNASENSAKDSLTTGVNVLDSINNKLQCITDIQSAFKDMEKRLLDRLIESKKDNVQLSLENTQKELSAANKSIMELKAKIKSQVKTREGDTPSPIQAEIQPPASTVSCKSCTDMSATLEKGSIAYANLQDAHRTLDDENDCLRGHIKQLQVQADNERSAKLSTQTILGQTETQLEKSRGRIDHLETSLQCSQKKVESLLDELFALKCHKQATDSSTEDFTPVQTKKSHSAYKVPTQNKFETLVLAEEPAVANVKSVDPVEKSDVPKTEKDNPPDLIIIGNSHVRNFSPNKLYKNKTTVIKSLENKTIRGAKDFVTKNSDRLNAKVIVLHTADNALANMSVDDCIRETEDLVALCKTACKHATICVANAMPRFVDNRNLGNEKAIEACRNYNKKAVEFNDILSGLASCTPIPLDNITEPGQFLGDGVHLKDRCFTEVVRHYKTVINPILGLKSYNQYAPSRSTDNHSDHYNKPRNGNRQYDQWRQPNNHHPAHSQDRHDRFNQNRHNNNMDLNQFLQGFQHLVQNLAGQQKSRYH